MKGVQNSTYLLNRYIALDSKVALASVHVASSHKSHNGVTHVYLQQVVNGLEVVNGVANVNVDSKGDVISVGNSFFKNVAPLIGKGYLLPCIL